MRILIVSLLLVVITAIVGVGWTLDQLFDRFANHNVSDEFQIYQEMGSQLAAILDLSADPERVLANDVNRQLVGMSLQARKNFPLPPSMLADFENGNALVLESDVGVSLHYYLPAHGEVLTITPSNYTAGTRSVIRLMFTMIFYIIVLTLLMLWLYPLIRRLNKLSSAAKDFGSGQLDRRISTDGVSYISDIEVEFNRMAERIQSLISDNKLLSSAVSHDLRTPLARLRFGIDTLEDSSNPQAREKYIKRLSADISEMEKLVSSLLEFAQLDHVLSNNVADVLSLESLVAQCVERNSHDIILTTLDIRGQHSVSGNASHFSMLLGNLLQNAHKYATRSVHVELKNMGNGTLLTVSDDGPGIPAPQRHTVLMPFSRGENNNTEKGHGLGLAIVNRIAQRYGGAVEIDDCPELSGARVSILFPENHRT